MLRIALVVILFQVVLQSVITEALCCDDIRSDIKNRTLAYNLLCSKKDPKLESCCGVIEQEIQRHKLALKILCPNNVTRKSCADLYKSGENKDGMYTIDPDGLGSFKVRCDMNTDGGGWTVFQRRQDGSQNFYRGWSDYKAGFGNLNGEFWLGLDKIQRLTKSGQNVLRVDLMDFNGAERYAKYGTFRVSDESNKYRLTIGKYSGDAGDPLTHHNQMKFTTKDSDNDVWGSNCATRFKGGWWYKRCHYSNLNGLYLGAGKNNASGINWYHWKRWYSLKKTTMKIRPNQF
ncbi:fibrinogen C domain-containing protein 1-B-like [Dendronephthya gigantea]|uniref:fibrinogen C domain-containing protein 1-B-like n=1 Tax=Dendronephthya gigantea TaxID=151771 RepID=UPI001069A7B9|nr:fibrinogen C domain-containing protein 1-B-like [Dendronephthya gigantea]